MAINPSSDLHETMRQLIERYGLPPLTVDITFLEEEKRPEWMSLDGIRQRARIRFIDEATGAERIEDVDLIPR